MLPLDYCPLKRASLYTQVRNVSDIPRIINLSELDMLNEQSLRNMWISGNSTFQSVHCDLFMRQPVNCNMYMRQLQINLSNCEELM